MCVGGRYVCVCSPCMYLPPTHIYRVYVPPVCIFPLHTSISLFYLSLSLHIYLYIDTYINVLYLYIYIYIYLYSLSPFTLSLGICDVSFSLSLALSLLVRTGAMNRSALGSDKRNPTSCFRIREELFLSHAKACGLYIPNIS